MLALLERIRQIVAQRLAAARTLIANYTTPAPAEPGSEPEATA